MFARVATQAGRRAFSTARAGVENVKKLQQQYRQDPHLHGADDPTWLRAGSKDKLVFGAMATFVGVSMLQIVSGVATMATSPPE